MRRSAWIWAAMLSGAVFVACGGDSESSSEGASGAGARDSSGGTGGTAAASGAGGSGATGTTGGASGSAGSAATEATGGSAASGATGGSAATGATGGSAASGATGATGGSAATGATGAAGGSAATGATAGTGGWYDPQDPCIGRPASCVTVCQAGVCECVCDSTAGAGGLGGSGGGDAGGASGAPTGGVGADGGAAGSAGSPDQTLCDELEAEYVTVVVEAQTCAPMHSAPQCEVAVQDYIVCGCRTFVNTGAIDEVARLEELAAQWLAQDCPEPAICFMGGACLDPQSAQCSEDGRCEPMM